MADTEKKNSISELQESSYAVDDGGDEAFNYLSREEAEAKGIFWIDPHPQTGNEKLKVYGQIMLLALPWVGVQCIWAAEFGTTTPYLIAMGLGEKAASNIWLSGPLMGFFVAPVVGSLSDKTHLKLGRRRPWMIIGLCLLALFSMLLANSKSMGDAGLTVAMVSFICLDGCINVIQTPLRALIADFAPPSQQSAGQLMASTFQGVGGLVGYVLQKYFYTDPLEVMVLFILVLVVNVVFVGLACFLIKEEHFPKPEGEKVSIAEPFIHLAKSIKQLTGKLIIVGCTVFFCWWGLFGWWPVSSSWYTTVVMEGCGVNPRDTPAGETPVCSQEDYDNYSKGLEVNANANILANVMQIIMAGGLSMLMTRGVIVKCRFIWSALLVVGCFLMVASYWIRGEAYAYIVGVGMAIPISGINAFPFAIVGKYNQESNEESGDEAQVGAQFGLLNLFIVVPQIIVTLVVGEMRVSLGLEAVMLMNGVAFGIAAIIAVFIKETTSKV
ncbi:hypothetical protein SARC_05935 [Sphaeroforma arctica JP610]|uniref:Major facilitator superfamily (MFS) profile domain-containing protein n=1 Tax=Sphaeroforma arctica JP610 TaxID=667725 RepID=A0A0L0FYX7_9EUKA|nr:hypothetical protein SARC_05935 [Sphaeroforma arctica JP610]KNC81766.1 hypothetical protein SARC_05935 [Sphaeroforma arctica JP610]|eukprot:XP_014155668.1 hypothetical protein SARC_05935 [Sphaeroforma arctica JP610]